MNAECQAFLIGSQMKQFAKLVILLFESASEGSWVARLTIAAVFGGVLAIVFLSLWARAEEQQTEEERKKKRG